MSTQVTAKYVAAVEAIAPLIADHVLWSQQERRLAPAVVEAFHDAGLLRLMIPRDLGGEGMDEYELVPIIEAVARIDASAGWNLAIGNGSLGLVRGLEEAAATEILSVPRVLAAGTVGLGVVLRQVDGGFRVSGRGGFASGCSQANWLNAGGLLVDDDGPVLGANGAPSIQIAFFPTEQAEIVDTWHVTGLRGTGSHDLVVRDLFVPAARVVEMGATRQSRFNPLGMIPVQSRLGSHLTAVAIGAAWHAVDELTSLATTKANFGTRP